MPRLVRKAPLSERIRAYLDPADFLIRLSEELNSTEWEDSLKVWAKPAALGLNILFMIARSNSRTSLPEDDLFVDFAARGSGWLAWYCSFTVWLLAILSFTNAFYTFSRTRPYRLFEKPIEEPLSTPSARRVKVGSSPAVPSPLRFLSNILSSESAESRRHPDATTDVWEIGIWDPTPLCLQWFCLFSPGHILIYLLFLPNAPLDPYPSLTVVKTILLTSLLSVQLSLLQSSHARQITDNAIISNQVMNEYNTKFVHPSLNKPVRDVGIQTPVKNSPICTTEVDTYTPTTIINRGFHTNPNPSYAGWVDRDAGPSNLSNRLRASGTPALRASPSAYTISANLSHTNTNNNPPSSPERPADFSSPIRAPAVQRHQPRVSNPYTSTGTGMRDGGSLGVYTHANSPLRKAASTHFVAPRRERDEERGRRRDGSPLKRVSTPGEVERRLRELRGEGDGRRRESGRF
ncbi:hypothetical protein M501DRAFT_997263 [Patellaria atrata CBS 101060]|uniref:Meiotically up-regulated gene 154 protein n=1 Tax=Patellaria atrata CBS 101060 TaxID=1346257 RepID=A0A9P4VLX7_9PEZI|nr:hypothetical protein M501DRAFT_997263 [Patellaria atrata CBS 101060]